MAPLVVVSRPMSALTPLRRIASLPASLNRLAPTSSVTSSTSTTTSIYTPLPSPRHLRLLVLNSGSSTDRVSCSLVVVSLDATTVSFEALSYAFEGPVQPPGGYKGASGDHDGSSTAANSTANGRRPATVRCGAVDVPISDSLHLALVTLRNRFRRRLLWVPFELCVNQADSAERSAQAKLMGDVFGRASRVLVWLGDETEPVRGAFKTVRRLRGWFPDGDPDGDDEDEGDKAKKDRKLAATEKLATLIEKERLASQKQGVAIAPTSRLIKGRPAGAAAGRGTEWSPAARSQHQQRQHQQATHHDFLYAPSFCQLANLLKGSAWFRHAWSPLAVASARAGGASGRAGQSMTGSADESSSSILLLLGRQELPLTTLWGLLAHLAAHDLDLAMALNCDAPDVALRAAQNLLTMKRLRESMLSRQRPQQQQQLMVQPQMGTRLTTLVATLSPAFPLVPDACDRLAAVVPLADDAEWVARELLLDYGAEEGGAGRSGELLRRWAIWSVQVRGELDFLGLVGGLNPDEHGAGEAAELTGSEGKGGAAESRLLPSWVPDLERLTKGSIGESHWWPGQLRSPVYRASGDRSTVHASFSADYSVLRLQGTWVDTVSAVAGLGSDTEMAAHDTRAKRCAPRTTAELLRATREQGIDPFEASIPDVVGWLAECGALALERRRTRQWRYGQKRKKATISWARRGEDDEEEEEGLSGSALLMADLDFDAEERQFDDFFRVMTLDCTSILGPEDKGVFRLGVEAVEAMGMRLPEEAETEVEYDPFDTVLGGWDRGGRLLRRVASAVEMDQLARAARRGGRSGEATSPTGLRRVASSMDNTVLGSPPGPPSRAATTGSLDGKHYSQDHYHYHGNHHAYHHHDQHNHYHDDTASSSCDSNFPAAAQSPTATSDATASSSGTAATTMSAVTAESVASSITSHAVTSAAPGSPAPVQTTATTAAATTATAARLLNSASLPRFDPRFGRLLRPLPGRRLCRTNAGRLGWVPEHSRPGDRIVIFDGAKVPTVVRWCGVGGGKGKSSGGGRSSSRYVVVGDAYIQGVMVGEAVSSPAEDDDWGIGGLDGNRAVVELV